MKSEIMTSITINANFVSFLCEKWLNSMNGNTGRQFLYWTFQLIHRYPDFVPHCSHNVHFYDAFLQGTLTGTAIDWKL